MTNITRYTPGPWLAQYATIYEVAGLTKIAEMYARCPGDWQAEDTANAALIAAAPALLEACEAALRHFDECAIGSDTPEILHAAIAKATS